MGYYINPLSGYYEGDRRGSDQDVPQRPSPLHVWDGEWVSGPTPVPQSVTMRQARLALFDLGKRDAVPVAIATMPSPQKEKAQIEWEYGSTVERNSPLVVSLGPALGLDLDQLFIDAAGL